MASEQELPFLLGWRLSFKVTLTKAICFLYKPNFLLPLSGAVFHTKPLSLCGQPRGEAGPAEAHQSVPPLSSAQPGDLKAILEKSSKSIL